MEWSLPQHKFRFHRCKTHTQNNSHDLNTSKVYWEGQNVHKPGSHIAFTRVQIFPTNRIGKATSNKHLQYDDQSHFEGYTYYQTLLDYIWLSATFLRGNLWWSTTFWSLHVVICYILFWQQSVVTSHTSLIKCDDEPLFDGFVVNSPFLGYISGNQPCHKGYMQWPMTSRVLCGHQPLFCQLQVVINHFSMLSCVDRHFLQVSFHH